MSMAVSFLLFSFAANIRIPYVELLQRICQLITPLSLQWCEFVYVAAFV